MGTGTQIYSCSGISTFALVLRPRGGKVGDGQTDLMAVPTYPLHLRFRTGCAYTTKVTYKLMERLILIWINEGVKPQLPCIQAGFRRAPSMQDQILCLTRDTEYTFESGKKVGAGFIDPTTLSGTLG